MKTKNTKIAILAMVQEDTMELVAIIVDNLLNNGSTKFNLI